MDPSLQSTSDGPAATTEEVVSSDEAVLLDELVAPDEAPFHEAVFPATASERLYKSVVLLHDTARKLNDIIRPYYRAFMKDVAAELRKEQSQPKLDLLELCRTTNVMDASLKYALSSGSWGVAKRK
jgi:hypothetical protein